MENRYLAYMLRLWQVGEAEGAVWRASLEDSHSGELHAFASLEALVAFLAAVTRSQRNSENGVGDGESPPGSESAQ